MAIWQVNFNVVPKSATQTYDFEAYLAECVAEGAFETGQFWKELSTTDPFFDKINEFLPKTKSWTESITLFGLQESNRFEVFSVNGFVDSVSFDIDFTSDFQDVLQRLIEFLKENELVVFSERFKLIELDFNSFLDEIRNSRGLEVYRFLTEKKEQ